MMYLYYVVATIICLCFQLQTYNKYLTFDVLNVVFNYF